MLHNSVPEPAQNTDIKSILKELELYQTSTPFHVEQPTPGRMEADSLEQGSSHREMVAPDSLVSSCLSTDRPSLLEQVQLYRSMFSTLTSSNHSLQEQVAQLTKEIAVS